MRRIHIRDLKPGAMLAKSVFSPDGKILASAGSKPDKNQIKQIADNGISMIYIEDDTSIGVQLPETDYALIRMQVKMTIDKLIESCYFSKSASVGKVKENIYRIINEIISDDGILANLYSIKSVDDYTFEHSINVCVLSLIIGTRLGYNMVRLLDLGVGSILHDIGKVRIPEEILKKPSKLTAEEFDEIKKHTVYGYDILKNNKNISMISSFIAMGHHERYDGSGYPLQIKGENIHQCARIVAVADVFDALSSDRVYRKRLKPSEVIDYITSLGSHHFDQVIVDSFINCISIYSVGTGVLLNTRERGFVVDINKKVPTRPVVRVIYNEKGEKLKKHYEIDLKERDNILIEDVYEL